MIAKHMYEASVGANQNILARELNPNEDTFKHPLRYIDSIDLDEIVQV